MLKQTLTHYIDAKYRRHFIIGVLSVLTLSWIVQLERSLSLLPGLV